jgi:hypothetical protein
MMEGMEAAAGGGAPGGGAAGERKVFGVALETIMQRPNEKRIPGLLKKMILFLNAEGALVMGDNENVAPYFLIFVLLS